MNSRSCSQMSSSWKWPLVRRKFDTFALPIINLVPPTVHSSPHPPPPKKKKTIYIYILTEALISLSFGLLWYPEYLRLSSQAVSAYNLRSSVAPLLCIPKESGTFQDTAELFSTVSQPMSETFKTVIWTLLQINNAIVIMPPIRLYFNDTQTF